MKKVSYSCLLILIFNFFAFSQAEIISNIKIDVFQLIMPNNSFAVSMAFKSIEESLKEFDCWKGEYIGIQPDIICSDADIHPTVIKITKDKNVRSKNAE